MNNKKAPCDLSDFPNKSRNAVKENKNFNSAETFRVAKNPRFRSENKSKIDRLKFFCVSDYPIWNYDGSSTWQATGANSDTFLYPVAVFRDPFRKGKNKIVLCDTYKHNKKPTGNAVLIKNCSF